MGCQRSDAGTNRSLGLLRRGADALAIDLDATALSRFQLYFELLVDHGSRHNLTAVRDYDGVQQRHFLESLSLGAALHREGILQGDEALADVGAGAGLPGLPLKIAWPKLHLTAIESTRKKAAFLELVAAELGLQGVSVVTARAEEAAHRLHLRERFDIVTARAVAPLPALAELLLPFARVGGWIAALKGSRLDAELAAGRGAIATCGGGGQRETPLGAGLLSIAARLLVIEKRGSTPRWLPRQPGTPARSPLT
jgi:16S rRNA (guanine527-N7)-methyltransferase